MSKPLPASQKVMSQYLKELLTDDIEPDISEKVILKPLERLLENVNKETPAPVETNYLKELEAKAREKEISHVIQQSEDAIAARKANNVQQVSKRKSYQEGRFQALFFEVAGLTIAVPLIDLGGIHNVGSINSLLGKPSWFMGVMLHKDEKINVVDTAKWVMPEKYNQDLKKSLNYQYIIMLNDSKWGLCAERMVNTVTLSQDDVKWRESSGKRPWLAGLVKERMCALIDVDALITLLDQGASVHQDY